MIHVGTILELQENFDSDGVYIAIALLMLCSLGAFVAVRFVERAAAILPLMFGTILLVVSIILGINHAMNNHEATEQVEAAIVKELQNNVHFTEAEVVQGAYSFLEADAHDETAPPTIFTITMQHDDQRSPATYFMTYSVEHDTIVPLVDEVPYIAAYVREDSTLGNIMQNSLTEEN